MMGAEEERIKDMMDAERDGKSKVVGKEISDTRIRDAEERRNKK